MKSGTSLLVCWLALVTGACRREMYDQPKLEPMERYDLFADRRSMRPQVPGTVARGRLMEDRHFHTGFAEQPRQPLELFPASEEALARTLARLAGPPLAETFPFSVTREHMVRGRERFEIFCAPCHGLAGYGDGIVVRRGFRRPPSYHIERLRQAPVGHFFDVISRGIGAMGDFADRIPPEDRWSVVAHLRALQLSQWARLEKVPEGVPPGRAVAPEIPPVRLQRDPAAELALLQAEQRARLASYGWVDPDKKILHIPIERAIDLLLERGLAARVSGAGKGGGR